jgi:hypothetical protein
MKKIFLFTAALLVAVALTGQTPVEYNRMWYFLNEADKTATLTNAVGGDPEAVIPEDQRYTEATPSIPATIYMYPDPTDWQGVEYKVTKIGRNAFNETPIQVLNLPKTILEIEEGAFYSCPSLKEVNISGSVEKIAAKNFVDCSRLKRIVFDESDKPLQIMKTNVDSKEVVPFANAPVNTFKMMRNFVYDGHLMEGKPLENIFVGKMVTEIPDYTFANLSNGYFQLYMYPAKAPSANATVFDGWQIVQRDPDDPNSKFYYEAYLDLMTYFETNDAVTAAGYNDGVWDLFYYGTKIAYCGDEVEYRDTYREGDELLALWDMRTQGNGEKDSIRYMTVNGRLLWFERYAPDEVRVIQPMFNYNKWGARPFRGIYNGGKYVIPDSVDFPVERYESQSGQHIRTDYFRCVVKQIGYDAFINSGVNEVVLPAHLKTISAQAFMNCPNLKYIDFPVSIEIIDAGAFADPGRYDDNPGGLEGTVVLPKNLKYLGEYAFRCCVDMENVIFPASLDVIPGYGFWGCDKLNNVVVPGTVKRIDMGAFSACANMDNITLSEGIDSLMAMIFPGCPLRELIIPASVTFIEESMLSRVGNRETDVYTLEHLAVKEGNKVYDSRDNCNAIIETKTNTFIAGTPMSFIPETVDSLASNCITEFGRIQSITLPKNLKKIQSYAVSGGITLQTVVSEIENPAGVLMVDGFAMWNEEEYPTIYIPAGTKAKYEADANWSKFNGHFVESKPATVEDIAPVAGEGAADFSTIPAGADMSNYVAGSLYITIDEAQGDLYDATEKALVLKTTVSELQMQNILNAARQSDVLQNIFSGMVMEVPAGNGTINITVQTAGGRKLAVMVAGSAAEYFAKAVKGDIEVNYDVTAPTFVYIYAVEDGTPAAAPAKLRRAPAATADAENSVSIYGAKWNVKKDATTIEHITNDQSPMTNKVIRDGQLLIIRGNKVYTVDGQEVK